MSRRKAFDSVAALTRVETLVESHGAVLTCIETAVENLVRGVADIIGRLGRIEARLPGPYGSSFNKSEYLELKQLVTDCRNRLEALPDVRRQTNCGQPNRDQGCLAIRGACNECLQYLAVQQRNRSRFTTY